MNHNILIIGLVVGLANYTFRYLPLRLSQTFGKRERRAGHWTSRVLDGIGIASICALLVVSSVPEILRDPNRLIPTLAGFAVLIGIFYKTRSIVIATLMGAVAYGLVYKLLI